MKIERVALIGGSGFLGSAVANQLAGAAVEVVVPTRRASRARHLLLLPTVDVVEADVHDPATLAHLVSGVDAVINLVGILHSRSGSPYGRDFARAHVELPQKIVAACHAARVPHLVHVSALGASPDGPSEYLRSKAAGEAAIRASGDAPAWTVLRPAVMFGRGDHFTNLFARLATRFPLLPLAGARARFQPVHVEDVAAVICRCLRDPAAIGETFELAGPRVYTLRELVEYISELASAPRPILPLPNGLAMMQAALMEWLPNPIMSRDNLRSMRVDNVASGAPLPFGMTPTPLEAVAPSYIGDRSQRARYYSMRSHSGRLHG
ncbi:complex I NDUFA9 subunit family protein [Aromatoleum aromaticum]|uniref:Predicted nucleoside-diphosphate-sugar epimerases n=1 Tax=Aromatoleum aromaticum (strain DSM 19018 / LMG 30748 / EbN1) TaxID=76114 RepID=Q5P3S8_AROAE|nr:complex I NDUFA9 subunit family protein [Aromatoleum aromaticum]NMG54346.1 NAD(P)H-binding protein [Aromatoleum aromaticum]CAI08036.1 predicted nucleoside-diphosphate-sugar epimerases [Aromatoleum aromaticum EbN1]